MKHHGKTNQNWTDQTYFVGIIIMKAYGIQYQCQL